MRASRARLVWGRWGLELWEKSGQGVGGRKGVRGRARYLQMHVCLSCGRLASVRRSLELVLLRFYQESVAEVLPLCPGFHLHPKAEDQPPNCNQGCKCAMQVRGGCLVRPACSSCIG